MKYILEFGNRGGAYTENVIVPTRKLAQQIARALVMTFENDPHAIGARRCDWLDIAPRETWKSEKHFVAVSKLDGAPRGPASAGLWRR